MAARKEFREVLEEVARTWVGYSHEDERASRDFRFCPSCGGELDRNQEMGFTCPSEACGYRGARSLTFRKDARFEIRDGRLYHYSVGAAVFCRFHEEQQDRVLLLRRATYPVGAFTVPSGHWDVPDLRPLEAAKRELHEETGLESVSAWELVSEANELLEEGCRRGCDFHYWHFYRCSCLPQEADLTLPVDRRRTVIGESDMIGWIPVSQVIAGRFQLTKPAGHFLGKILDAEIPNVLER